MQAQCKKISGAIDQQVKAVEQAQREEKHPPCGWSTGTASGNWNPLISFDRLLVPQWLNKTLDLAQAERNCVGCGDPAGGTAPHPGDLR